MDFAALWEEDHAKAFTVAEGMPPALLGAVQAGIGLLAAEEVPFHEARTALSRLGELLAPVLRGGGK